MYGKNYSINFKLKRRKFLLIFPAITFGLGTWQIFRLQEKEALIERMNRKLMEEPCVLLKSRSEDMKSLEHRRLRIKGNFLHDMEMLIGPRKKYDEIGYNVYTPFKPKDSSEDDILIVNRGWIPMNMVDINKRSGELENPRNVVEIQGMLRDPVRYKPSFTSFLVDPCSHQLKTNHPNPQWLWIDMPSMIKFISEYLKICGAISSPKINSNFIVEQFSDFVDEDLIITKKFTGVPICGPPSTSLPNKHKIYITTWYSLTGLLCLSLALF